MLGQITEVTCRKSPSEQKNGCQTPVCGQPPTQPAREGSHSSAQEQTATGQAPQARRSVVSSAVTAVGGQTG